MKKLIILIITLLTVITVNAQTTVYKKSELKKMSKTTLTEIYLNEVTKLFVNLPYTPFTIFGNGMTDVDSTTINSKLDVPVSEYFESKRAATIVGGTTYSILVRSEIQEVIPYCDKKDIVTSIIYLQKVNNNIKVQQKGSKFFFKKLLY